MRRIAGFLCTAYLALMLPTVYFPPRDSEGGWRTRRSGDLRKLDEAFEIARSSTKNGGVLVLHNGWLVYERYFGLADRDATPNLGSVGKAFTSIAAGVLIAEHPKRFPQALDQRVFTPEFMPPQVFPLADPQMADIRLGHLLAFSAGIRGNNPCYVNGAETMIDPPGPDGWQAMVDEVAAGKRTIDINGSSTRATPLWCRAGDGYSYATASSHLASMVIREVSGMELEEYLRSRIAVPLGWGSFTYGYRYAREMTHTPGGGGIAGRATDMLRFGYLLLNQGRWGDRQLVPAEFVRACGNPSPYNPHFPYSLGFEVNADGHVPEFPKDAFWKSGSGGHVLYVVPSRDLVVWKLGGRDSQYQQEDTGVPLSRTQTEQAADPAWKPGADAKSAERRVLAKVIEALGQ